MTKKAKSTPVPESREAVPASRRSESDHDLLWRTPDALLVVDKAGLICGTNDAASPLTGRTRTALLGTEIARLDPPEGAGLSVLLAGLAAGATLQGEGFVATAAGERRAVELSAFRLPEPDGRAYLFLRDSGARHRRHAELEAENTRLAAAAARADELAHAAEAANRAKSAFLASMSHELRTPLNVINGLAATLAEESRDSTEVHSAQLILESGQNLLALVEELIDFSGLQAGRAKLEPRPFDLLGLVTQIVRQTGTLARRKGLGFTYRIRPEVPARVVGDPRRLQQVLLNLLGNAVNYTQRGCVHLDISARVAHGRWRIAFAVADTGVGISAADLAKLFQPFARAEFGGARQVHGTGLGLAIAAAFAELMGGGITVRSRPGHGTIFRCVIDADESEGGAALATLAPPGMTSRRILVVVSDQLTRRLLADLFRSWECVPVVWPGADQPMDRDQLEQPIDLAVVEAALARNLGPMLNRHLQARPPARPAPVVWLSSPERHWPVPPAARALNVQLPLDPAELARAVAGLLAPGRDAGGLPAVPEAKLGARLPLRILAADDIPTNREMLRRLLQHLGYRANLACNGAEAVEALRLQPFDLILLDVEMPVMNGLAAAREIIRQYPEATRRPKLVALTANAQSGDRERCLAAGMDDYLPKPVLPSHLEACFQRLFGAGAPAVEPAPAPSAGPDLVDRDQLNAMFPGLPPAQVAEVLQQLQASATRDLETAWPRLGKACAARDCAHLAETAHGLKGCFMMLGWSRLAAHCSEAVLQARRGTFNAWSTFGPELQRLYDLSAAEMGCFLEELNQSPAKPSDR